MKFALLLLLLVHSVASSECCDASSTSASALTEMLHGMGWRLREQLATARAASAHPEVRLFEVRLNFDNYRHKIPDLDESILYREVDASGTAVPRVSDQPPVYSSATNQAMADAFDRVVSPAIIQALPKERHPRKTKKPRRIWHYDYYPVLLDVVEALDAHVEPLPRQVVVFLPRDQGFSMAPSFFDRAVIAGRALSVQSVPPLARELLGLDDTPSSSAAGLFVLIGHQRGLIYDLNTAREKWLKGATDQTVLQHFMQMNFPSPWTRSGYLYPHFFGSYVTARRGLQRLWSEPDLAPEMVFPRLYAPVTLPSPSATTPRQATAAERLDGTAP